MEKGVGVCHASPEAAFDDFERVLFVSVHEETVGIDIPFCDTL